MNNSKSHQFIDGASFIMLGEEPIQNSTTQKMFAQIMQNKTTEHKRLNQQQAAPNNSKKLTDK
jgi:hypothetical protein